MNTNTGLEGMKRRFWHLQVLFIILLFLVIILSLMGGLAGSLTYLLIYGVALILISYPLHNFFASRRLRPVEKLLNSQEPTRREVEFCLHVVNWHPIRDAAWSLVFWVVGISGLIAVLSYQPGLTPWQKIQILSLGLAGLIIDCLVVYHTGVRIMGQVRLWVESKLPTEYVPEVTGNLSRRLLLSFGVVLVLCLGLILAVVKSRQRETAAKWLLNDNLIAFRSVARSLQEKIVRNDTQLERLIESVSVTPIDKSDLVIVDNDGNLLAGGKEEEAIWYRRIVEKKSDDWLDYRAPFVYQRMGLSKKYHLLYRIDTNKLDMASAGYDGYSLITMLLLVLLGLMIAWMMVGSELGTVRSVTSRVRRLVQGDWKHGLVASGGGEMAALIQAIEDFAFSSKQMIRLNGQVGKDVLLNHGELMERLVKMRQGSEQHLQLSEQTANSVIDMRSTIEGISHQVDQLRESTSDCSASLFEIEQSIREVTSAADGLHRAVKDSNLSTSQVSHSQKEILKNLEDLSRQAEDGCTSISAMDRAIQQVESNTNETQRLSDEVIEIASRGAQSVRETITGINEIQEVTDESREVITRLGTQMEAVGKILTVISEVAKQTNLLALNAAIIAAAAGEHGKGFAVVADEIKDLADRTASSTKEIAGLIKSVQADSRRAVDAIERGSGSVRHGVQLANNAGKALQQILFAVGQVNSMATEIARSTKEHSQLAAIINRSMLDMSEVLRELRRAMMEQAKTGDRMQHVSAQLAEDAQFVVRSSTEQVQVIGGVSQSMEEITEMVTLVSKAISEQSQGVDHVARIAEEALNTTKLEKERIIDLESIAEQIGDVARRITSPFDPDERTQETIQ